MGMWYRRRAFWTLACFTWFVLCAMVARLTGGPALATSLKGALVGAWLFVVVFGGVEIAAPQTFLRWRAWMGEGSPPRLGALSAVADARLLSPAPAAVSRLRVAGFMLIGIVTVEVAAL